MRFGIVGSRGRLDRQSVYDRVAELPRGSTVVSGGAKGPDIWAEEAAKSCGLPTIVHLPASGPSATRWAATEKFYARNQQIVDDSDVLIAFVSPDRKGGTEDTIRRARKKGIPVILA
jgi:predicted Rossmann fold nucleotide-binding protein DprA/Smf involved in DNA uptake